MERCLELAVRGRRRVSPNPMVGCVIVKNGSIVGQGYHRRFGGAHAEIYALRVAGRKAEGATVYVNLEPCSHYGKTPPCVDALLKAGVKRVVAAARDPNPVISGRGIAALRRNGVRVDVGILRREAERLNQRFFTFMRTGLPFVGVKIAQTLDGSIADARGSSKWITSAGSRREGHRLRAQYDAILVGAGTVVKDDPELTVRGVKGRNPVRVVLDAQLSCPASAKVFRTKAARTVLFTTQNSSRRKPRTIRALVERGVRVIAVESRPMPSIDSVLHILAALGISSIMVEGGSKTVSAFLACKHVNRVHWFIAPRILGGGLPSVSFTPPLRLAKSIVLARPLVRTVGPDFLIEADVKYE